MISRSCKFALAWPCELVRREEEMGNLAQILAGTWLFCPCPNPSASGGALIRLLDAGGSRSPSSSPGRRLCPPASRFCAYQLPGRETRFREVPFTSCQPLIAALADAVADAMDRPYAVFGHGMGALLAFELVRALRRLDRPEPVRLIVAGRTAPHHPQERTCHRPLPDLAFRAELRDRQGTPDAVLENDDLMLADTPTFLADLAGRRDLRLSIRKPLWIVPLTVLSGTDGRRGASAKRPGRMAGFDNVVVRVGSST